MGDVRRPADRFGVLSLDFKGGGERVLASTMIRSAFLFSFSPIVNCIGRPLNPIPPDQTFARVVQRGSLSAARRTLVRLRTQLQILRFRVSTLPRYAGAGQHRNPKSYLRRSWRAL
jgi:hypothetical protein